MSDEFSKEFGSEFKPPDEVKKELEKFLAPLANPKVDPKQATEEEIVDLDYTAEINKEKVRRLKEDNDARKSLREPIFAVSVIWMFLVLMFVGLCGQGRMHLSDTVLVALITTTTANVLGFFYIVIRYLYNPEKST